VSEIPALGFGPGPQASQEGRIEADGSMVDRNLPSAGKQVTVVIRHRIRPGKEKDMEAWIRGITGLLQTFPGSQGFHVVRPTNPLNLEYLILIRFDTLSHLEHWENSPGRLDWIAKLQPLLARPSSRERHCGLEVWFDAPADPGGPPRYKVVVVTLVGLYPLALLIQTTAAYLLGDWPIPLRTAITAACTAALMIYLVMPLLSRWFASYLYGHKRT